METEEDDIPSGPASQPTRPWLSYSPSTESFLSEGTEQDDDKVTKARQSSTGQAGEISRGRAEAHAQIRSSRELGDDRSCETTREVLAKAKADLEQGIAETHTQQEAGREVPDP